MEYVAPDFVLKLVFLGDTGVGKTSLVQRYVYDSLPPELEHTIGAVLHVKLLQHKGNFYKLVVWDIGGGDSFTQLREQYCANASGAFFVFDRTRPETLRSIDHWLEALHSAAGNVPVVMVENKIDLEQVVEPKEIMEIAEAKVDRLIQTSATENINVDMAFTSLVEEIRQRREA